MYIGPWQEYKLAQVIDRQTELIAKLLAHNGGTVSSIPKDLILPSIHKVPPASADIYNGRLSRQSTTSESESVTSVQSAPITRMRRRKPKFPVRKRAEENQKAFESMFGITGKKSTPSLHDHTAHIHTRIRTRRHKSHEANIRQQNNPSFNRAVQDIPIYMSRDVTYSQAAKPPAFPSNLPFWMRKFAGVTSAHQKNRVASHITTTRNETQSNNNNSKHHHKHKSNHNGVGTKPKKQQQHRNYNHFLQEKPRNYNQLMAKSEEYEQQQITILPRISTPTLKDNWEDEVDSMLMWTSTLEQNLE